MWLNGSITYYFACITMVLLPVYHWYLPLIMILWGVVWINEIRLRYKDLLSIEYKHKVLFFLFISFFVWQVIGLLYSDNSKEGIRNISLHLSLFLFPLVLVSPGSIIKIKINTLLKLFALSTFLFLLVCYGFALYRSIGFQNGILIFNPHLPVYTWLNYFYASELAIFQHPSYLSMYILLAAFISIESFLDVLISRNMRIFWLAGSLILLASIYFLSSRAAILTTIITVPLYGLFKSKIGGGFRYLRIVVLGCTLILVPVLLTNQRVKTFVHWKSGKELSDLTSKEGRMVIWNSVNNILKKNIVFGVGTGDIQSELNKEYIKTGNSKLAEGNFNSHNQFIEVILEHGLIGLVIFLSAFGMMFYLAYSEKNILYTMFLVIVFTSFLFETMLNRLGGVSFFALFSFLLIHVQGNRGKKIVTEDYKR